MDFQHRILDLFSALKHRAFDLLSALKQRAFDLVSVLKPRASELLSTLKPRASELLSTLKRRASEQFSALKHRASELLSALKQRIHAPKPRRDNQWALPDLVDFEYYLDRDEEALRQGQGARKALTDRDRSIYMSQIEPLLTASPPHAPLHRRWCLRRWLEARRDGEGREARALLPGTTLAQAQRLVVSGLAVVGFLLGTGAASALLSYEGERPVNVTWFVFLLVGVQVLIITGGVLVVAIRGSRALEGTFRDIRILDRLIRPLFARACRWIQRHRLAHVSQEVRDRTMAGAGRLKAHHALYGQAYYFPLLIPAQVFGVAFNLGAILTTLAMEWFTDLAFGWGSTLDIDPHTVYELVRGIATPWRWLFGEGIGYPTLDQIAGSRIHLKDPLSLLQAEHLRSWRWFLALSVVAYGLLPRLALLVASIYAQRLILGRLSFTHGRTQAVYARMVTPRIETGTAPTAQGPEMPIPAPIVPRPSRIHRRTPTSTPVSSQPRSPRPSAPNHRAEAPTVRLEGRGYTPPPTGVPETPEAPAEPANAEPKAASIADTSRKIAADACLLLIHVDVDEILGEDDRTRLAQLLMNHTGWRVADAASFGSGSAMIEGTARWVQAPGWQAPPPRVAIIMDGSQPPITENLRFLRELRAAAGTRAQILLSLVGDPTDDDPLPPVRAFDFADWRRKIDAMGDPYLRLEMLTAPGEDDDG